MLVRTQTGLARFRKDTDQWSSIEIFIKKLLLIVWISAPPSNDFHTK